MHETDEGVPYDLPQDECITSLGRRFSGHSPGRRPPGRLGALACMFYAQIVLNLVPVQSFGSDSIKSLRTRTGSGSENCIPDCGRPVVFVPKFAEVELTFPDPMYEFNTGDGG